MDPIGLKPAELDHLQSLIGFGRHPSVFFPHPIFWSIKRRVVQQSRTDNKSLNTVSAKWPHRVCIAVLFLITDQHRVGQPGQTWNNLLCIDLSCRKSEGGNMKVYGMCVSMKYNSSTKVSQIYNTVILNVKFPTWLGVSVRRSIWPILLRRNTLTSLHTGITDSTCIEVAILIISIGPQICMFCDPPFTFGILWWSIKYVKAMFLLTTMSSIHNLSEISLEPQLGHDPPFWRHTATVPLV